jgi:hypothetical protein
VLGFDLVPNRRVENFKALQGVALMARPASTTCPQLVHMVYTLRGLLIVLLFTQCALAQEPGSVLYGSWTATAGPSQIFRGTWSAETSRRIPNEAQGSWTLVNDSGEVVLQGTWSARKTGSRWQGTWRARTTKGQSFSGSWETNLTESTDQTFAALLKRTIEKEVAGSWQSGLYRGNWWLKGLNAKK